MREKLCIYQTGGSTTWIYCCVQSVDKCISGWLIFWKSSAMFTASEKHQRSHGKLEGYSSNFVCCQHFVQEATMRKAKGGWAQTNNCSELLVRHQIFSEVISEWCISCESNFKWVPVWSILECTSYWRNLRPVRLNECVKALPDR